jgi:hypothetical protein
MRSSVPGWVAKNFPLEPDVCIRQVIVFPIACLPL